MFVPVRTVKLSTALAVEAPTALRPAPSAIGVSDPAVQLVLGLLEDAKAEDIVTIDLGGKTTLADAMIVASGRSQRHVGAIVDRLARALKEHGYGRIGIEGTPHCDWVLLDVGDVIVHVFRPEVRSFYNLEKMWAAERPVERAGA